MKARSILIKKKIHLRHFRADDDGGLDKEQTKEQTEILGLRLDDLQQLLYANSTHALLLIFQGMDASGKDGCVRTVLKHVNPAGVETTSFKVPSEEERAHDFLWRIHKAVPRYGRIGVFNRSHYEAVLAERILKIASKPVWSLRYQQIVDFEQMLVANKIIILKFYLHISKDEQAKRFKERLSDPRKNWKFMRSDLETRKHWNNYMDAYEQMLNATSHPAAPWRLIPADRNWYRNFLVTQAVAETLEKLKMTWPKPTEDLSKIKII